MLVKSMKTLADARNGALTAAYRAGLRSRTFRTASLNAPTAPLEVIPVTTVDGARLRVHAYGPADGQVIVLIHGWSCSIEYWNPQINALADRYRVVCYDQRGHGASELGALLPTRHTLADDLSAVLDAALRPGQRAILAGHSMGGITIQAWAARYPEQVLRRASAAVLLNTTSGNIRYDTDLLPLLNKQLVVQNKPVTLLGAPVRMPTFLSEAVLTSPVPLPGGPLVCAVLKSRVMCKHATVDEVNFALGIVRGCRPLARGRHAAALADIDVSDGAAHLTIPTTVIAGRHDHLLPERMSRRIADELSRTGHLAAYHSWPTGHLGNIEAADRFNAVLESVAQQAGLPAAAAG
ncbi:pimeloyl-ACP methyl ester carboxylesterase [Nocardia tenerifensis]|uniref:Pimeloyl-ACP methyl ester carboxylesterase n=1 Tax=Nocardia tenerifensis TaxID=228006 RepID=A0A318K0J1_9NOCA|nr:alpha/beta hydrolase [Nocardia tenerifensis]PXX63318.1 pimeloyl-ACP methyl ester carboxylesterase [Nocardia tenerifensis]